MAGIGLRRGRFFIGLSKVVNLIIKVKKYNINRVIHRFGDVQIEDIWGIAEFWFDDMKSAQRAVGRVQGAPPDEPHTKRITPAKRFITQEEEIEL